MRGSAGGKVLKLLWPSWDQMRSMHTAFGAFGEGLNGFNLDI